MQIRFGYRITIESPGPLPLVTQMAARPERRMDLRGAENVTTLPEVAHSQYIDAFGNLCTRMTTPGGVFTLTSDAVISDSGDSDPALPTATEDPVESLSDDVLVFLMPSRFCESDLLGNFAWQRFGAVPPGWGRVQAVVDYVHDHIRFNYGDADATRTAYGAWQQQKGVCRDFAHLAIALCRALNIPARYVNGYLGDIGVPPDPNPMDFAAWMQVWLSGRWWTFDPRNNTPRVGRITVGIGRDAVDVALMSSFGQHKLLDFKVWTDQVDANGNPVPYAG